MNYLRGWLNRTTEPLSDIRPFIMRMRASRERADIELRASSASVRKLKEAVRTDPPFEKDMFPRDAMRNTER